MEKTLRLVAGIMILLSVLLIHFVNYNWIWFTVFIAFNLIQSYFTNWCLMMNILKKIGIKD